MARILVIEDQPALADGIRLNLQQAGHAAMVAHEGESGLRAARSWEPDLLVLDLVLPGLGGLTVLRLLRNAGLATPVLILSALGKETDRLQGFRAGADDYLVKPFSIAELLARVEAILRRTTREGVVASSWCLGDVVVDADTRQVTRAGQVIALRPRALDLLIALLRRGGRVATRRELLDEVWGYQPDVESRTIDVHIVHLRQQLEVDPNHPTLILTVPRRGYRAGI